MWYSNMSSNRTYKSFLYLYGIEVNISKVTLIRIKTLGKNPSGSLQVIPLCATIPIRLIIFLYMNVIIMHLVSCNVYICISVYIYIGTFQFKSNSISVFCL